MDLIGLLVIVLVIALIYWAIHRIAAVAGLSPMIVTMWCWW
jgi:hypothetical protein